MSPWALGTAWALSLLSLVLAIPVEQEGGTLSRTVLCALPWIALVGVPRGSVSSSEKSPSWWSFHSLMLPLVAVGLGLDHASGNEPLALTRLGLVILGLTSVLALATHRSRRSFAQACLWTLLVPVPFALAALPEFEGPALLSGTPLVWGLRELVSDPAHSAGSFSWERDLGLVLLSASYLGASLFFRSSKEET